MPDKTCTFQIKCQGRRAPGIVALEEPVSARLIIGQVGNTIDIRVKCKYNTGGHGQRCKASHPEADKVGEGVYCPYSLDVPFYHDLVLVNPRP